jgi:acyl-coenzyme A synthetase/AMP-(fatty) acid ligase
MVPESIVPAFRQSQSAVPGERLPLLGDADCQRTIAWWRGRAVRVDEFLAHVDKVARHLPPARYVVNLCDNRYLFLVTFCAAMSRGQTTLMPPSRAAQAVAAILAAHPGAYALGEQAMADVHAPYVCLPPLDAPAPGCKPAVPMLATDLLASIGFTSGSSGRPTACHKTWGQYAASTAGNLAVLRRHLAERFQVLATVPPQHMYGMEMSVLLPLFGHIGVHGGRPLLPGDVASALGELPAPRVLVTTPVHLRALVESGQAMPPLAAMVSATAPLPGELARAAERCFAAPLLELFGSTETCVFASRRSIHEDAWMPYPGVRVFPQPDGTRIEAPQLAHPVVLADIVELNEEGRFRLVGRHSDLLDMAGKRASLAELNQRLLAIEGVTDGVIFQLDAPDALGVRRLAGLVVAPDRSKRQILAALRESIDPVFLPRVLHKVDALPRNGTGKLPRAALLAMLQQR